MSEWPLVSIVIPTWDNKDILRNCVTSLLDSSYPSYEIIVVDNGSTDGSSEMIASEFSGVRLIRSQRNLGFAAGCNLGIRNTKGEMIALFNDDARVKRTWLTNLVNRFLNESDVCAASGVILYDSPGDIVWSAGAKIDPITGIDWRVGEGGILAQLSRNNDIDYVSGCALLFPKRLISRVGMLNENYFLYCEELDWILSAKRLGYKCVVEPSAIVWHKASATRRKMPLKGYYYQMRGLFRIYFKHFPLRYLISSLIFQLLVFPMTELFVFRTSPFFVVKRAKAFGWSLANLRASMIERAEVNQMGRLRLKNRFREFLEISMKRVITRQYDF
jgi:GT2 family glycosyltransferase